MFTSLIPNQQTTAKINGYGHLLYLAISITLLTGFTQAATAERILPIDSEDISLRSTPFLNPSLMRGWWEPFREHIYAQTGMIVRISSSPDYAKLFIESAQKRYDLYLVPDHFIPLLSAKHAAKPLVAINLKGSPKLIHHKNLDIKNLAELRNKCIAMPHEIALNSILAKEWLATQGLSPYGDYQAVHLTSFQEVVMKVISGKCDAGIITSVILRSLPTSYQTLLTVYDMPQEDRVLGGLSILAREGLDPGQTHSIQNALLSFGKTQTTSRHLTSSFYALPTIFDKKKLEEFEQQYQSIQPLLNRYLPTE